MTLKSLWKILEDFGNGDWNWRLEIVEGDWKLRLEIEIGSGDWNWRLAIE